MPSGSGKGTSDHGTNAQVLGDGKYFSISKPAV